MLTVVLSNKTENKVQINKNKKIKDGSYSGDNSMHLIYFTALTPRGQTPSAPVLFLVSEDYKRERS